MVRTGEKSLGKINYFRVDKIVYFLGAKEIPMYWAHSKMGDAEQRNS
jgi:hypothetical protein